ncbi:tyrosine-type recombinase/integrase [Spongiibacter tropicus]
MPVDSIRDWIVHLEQINQSPNTIQAYARHIARLGSYLRANGKNLEKINVTEYDQFLQWLPYHMKYRDAAAYNLAYFSSALPPLSPTLRNQVHLAVKSYYRYHSGRTPVFATVDVSQHYQPDQSYKSFLEHINARRTSRKKDPYLQGDLGKVRRKITQKRMSPESVLDLIRACHLIRDAFLITLLYNTGMRIGEALGLRHSDIDLADKIIWIIPRSDNENGARAKSRRARAVPVMPYVIAMYEDYITDDEYAPAFESGTEYVFCNVAKGRIGKALSKSYSENLKGYLIKRTGYQFTWHHFRHTHASEAIADGHGLLAIADRLGHASPQTTLDFYKHLFSSEVRKLHLSGPDRLEKRLEELRSAGISLSTGGLKWI